MSYMGSPQSHVRIFLFLKPLDDERPRCRLRRSLSHPLAASGSVVVFSRARHYVGSHVRPVPPLFLDTPK